MASARNLCQHSDIDGTQCISNDYILCPHCQLQLCLKHLNSHQDLLRSELHLLSHDIDHLRMNFDHLIFDSTNQREYLFHQLDQWYDQQLNFLSQIYAEKKQQIQVLCLKSHMEFDIYKNKKEKQLKDNLIKQLNKVLQQKQIHIEDFNEMKNKLDYIQRGLDELKQLNIDIQFNPTNFDINIIKKRYVEAAKPLFNDDDDNLWNESGNVDDDNYHHHDDSKPTPTSSPLILFPSSTISVKKGPLKLVIKRLQHPSISTEIKYKLHPVNTSFPLIT